MVEDGVSDERRSCKGVRVVGARRVRRVRVAVGAGVGNKRFDPKVTRFVREIDREICRRSRWGGSTCR
jgi:hypothetical protein